MDKNLILKYNKPGPRYTSYPPANYFNNSFSSEDHKKYLKLSNSNGSENISIYIHVPFCPRLCYFCGCSTSLLTKEENLEEYFNALLLEIENVSALLDKSRPVTQVHWGGGTPNAVPMHYIEQVMKSLNNKFSFQPKAEIAMECSPAYLSFEDVYRLADMGFNRISLGIQDFNNEVLKAVNRKASKHNIEELVAAIRKSGIGGVNIDLIYGLPLQTVENFGKTIDRAIKTGPDRLVTFSYAHVPWIKPGQQKLEAIGLPSPDEKLDLFELAFNKLSKNGYVSIGMDHYAKPDDELAIAQKNKLLHRNFQGYCTKESTGQVYAFGTTSISQLFRNYAQNVKDTRSYIKLINETGFAIDRGYILKDEEVITGKIINELMCNGILDFEEMAEYFNTSPVHIKEIIGYEKARFEPFIADELLDVSGLKLKVTDNGMLVVRNIAMALDPLLDVEEKQFSKTI